MNMVQSTPVVSEQHFHVPMTAWHNPTNSVVRVRIFLGHAEAPHPRPYKRGERHNAHIELVWNPNEVVQVPSNYDRAIQDTRGGMIVGGEAPMLRRIVDGGDESVAIAESLDTEGLKHRQAMDDAKAALAAKTIAEEALMLSAAKALEAQKAIDAAAAAAAVVAPADKPAAAPAPKAKG